MEREANYVTVGAFVLLVLAMGGFFVYWYTDRGDKREYERYEIYFQGSVSGLTEGSPVRYLGVPVGRVVAMHLDPRQPDRVQVIVDIDRKAPVSKETLASLSLQGVTGLLYIDLERDRGDKPVMKMVQGERYPVIRSVQSNFDLLVAGLPDLFTRLTALADRLSKVFSDDNIAAISQTLGNVNRASSEVPGMLREARQLVSDLRGASGEIQATAASIHEITSAAGPDITTTLERLRTVADNMASTSARLDRFVEENQANVTRFSDRGLAELQLLIRDGRQAAQEFRELTRSLKSNPSQLIYEQKYPGVEIAR